MEIIPYEEKHFSEVVKLQNHYLHFSLGNSGRLFQWRHRSHASIVSPMAVVAVEKGEVVATRSASGLMWRVGQNQIPVMSANFGGTVVKEGFEGQYLVQKMTRLLNEIARENNCVFGINTSPGKVVKILSKRAGWRSLSPPHIMLKKAIESNTSVKNQFIFDRFDETLAQNAEFEGFHFSTSNKYAGVMANICTTTPSRHAISVLKDNRYFQWRRCNPYCQYRTVFISNGDTLGFALLSKRRGRKLIYVLDMVCESPDLYAPLIRYLVSSFKHSALAISVDSIPVCEQQTLLDNSFGHDQAVRLLKNTYMLSDLGNNQTQLEDIHGIDLLNTSNWDQSVINIDSI